jgi:acetyltransferase-like isoleucine patch superfamily enzyme
MFINFQMKNINPRLLSFILRSLPNFLWILKWYLIKTSLKNVGKNFKFGYLTFFSDHRLIEIGDDVFIGNNFYCSAIKGLIIKNRVMFGANCSVIGGDHQYNNPVESMRFSIMLGDNRKILIEDDAWIGHGSILLKKSHISEGCIIGANSLVNTRTKPYCIYVGQPAKFIKPRFESYLDLCEHLKMMKDKFGFVSIYSQTELSEIYNTGL